MYDSLPSTLEHIKQVNKYLLDFAKNILTRAQVHDTTKIQEPEKAGFDKYTPLLKTLTYGTPEYDESLANLKVTLKHHYENNSHHPEHYPNGVNGMDLGDLVEMFFDWKAATERVADGNIYKSIDINAKRFEMSPQLVQIFLNTANRLNWEK